jgi:hypothetical protein
MDYNDKAVQGISDITGYKLDVQVTNFKFHKYSYKREIIVV